MKRIFLLLGGNLGDRQYYLAQAIKLLSSEIAPVVQRSSVYETQAWGKTDTPDYLNQVVMLESDIPPGDLLKRVLEIELLLGRTREERWGARTIDIDILFYGTEIVDEEGLQIPHPELHNRRFTLEPLAEIAPDLIHPELDRTIRNIKNELKDGLIVKKL